MPGFPDLRRSGDPAHHKDRGHPEIPLGIPIRMESGTVQLGMPVAPTQPPAAPKCDPGMDMKLLAQDSEASVTISGAPHDVECARPDSVPAQTTPESSGEAEI